MRPREHPIVCRPCDSDLTVDGNDEGVQRVALGVRYCIVKHLSPEASYLVRTFLAAIAAALIGLAPTSAFAQIGPGTVLVGSMDQGVDSKNVQVGQRFTMSDVHSQDNNINGGTIYGHVSDVQRASQGRPGKIELAFDKLRTRSGNSYALSGRAQNVQTNTKNNALKEVGGAVAGMIVGNILGKAVGTNLGGALGAGGGYLYAKNNKENVSIPQHAVVSVQVTSARRQSAG
jgi:hypothetical protein